MAPTGGSNSLPMCLELFLVDYEEKIRHNNFEFQITNLEIKDFSTPICELPQYILDNTNLREDILASAEILKEMTNSSGVDFFLVNSRSSEVFKYPSMCRAEVYKIGPGTVMAAYAAGKKVPVVSNDISKNKEFPFGVSSQAIITDAAMCLPIVTSKNNVVGVIQLIKDNGSHFGVVHVEMGMNMCNWIGSSIEQFYEKEDTGRENDLYAYFTHLINRTVCEGESYLNMLPEMLALTSRTLNAETCNYYTYSMFTALEDLGDKLIMFSPGGNEKFEKRIELELSSVTVANEVTMQNKIVNLSGDVISSNYISVIYKPREVTSILAAPIKVIGSIRGVFELINKRDNACFTERDILILKNVSSFFEFVIANHVLENQWNNLHNFLAYRHDTMIYHMHPCVQNLKLMNLLASDRASNRAMEAKLDLPIICFDIDSMFHSVMNRWKRIEEEKRHFFLLMIMKASLQSPMIDLRKIWASVQFVTSVLRTYSNHFTETEKEVMLFSALCHDVNNPPKPSEDIDRPYYLKPFPDPDNDFKSEFIPCDSFYFVKTIFVKSQIFHFSELKQLMEQINIYMQVCHSLKTFDTKEKLLKLLISNHFRPKSAKHRYLMRVCIMAVAGQAIFLKPALFTANILLNILIATRGCNVKCGSILYAFFPYISSKEEFTRAILMHLKLNILPWVILLRAILPRLKLYLKRCLETIDDWKKFKVKDMGNYWIPETSKTEAKATNTAATYLVGASNVAMPSFIRKTHIYKRDRKKKRSVDVQLKTRGKKVFERLIKDKKIEKELSKSKKRKKEKKKWEKLVKACYNAREKIDIKSMTSKSASLKKAISKRKELENVLLKRKACLSSARSYDDQKNVIQYSKKSKNKISNKLMNALAKNPDKVKSTLNRLIGNKRK